MQSILKAQTVELPVVCSTQAAALGIKLAIFHWQDKYIATELSPGSGDWASYSSWTCSLLVFPYSLWSCLVFAHWNIFVWKFPQRQLLHPEIMCCKTDSTESPWDYITREALVYPWLPWTCLTAASRGPQLEPSSRTFPNCCFTESMRDNILVLLEYWNDP